MSESREDNEVGVEAAGPSPMVEAAEILRIRLETEIIREQWREENGGE